jgi:hypothetical protein
MLSLEETLDDLVKKLSESVLKSLSEENEKIDDSKLIELLIDKMTTFNRMF